MPAPYIRPSRRQTLANEEGLGSNSRRGSLEHTTSSVSGIVNRFSACAGLVPNTPRDEDVLSAESYPDSGNPKSIGEEHVQPLLIPEEERRSTQLQEDQVEGAADGDTVASVYEGDEEEEGQKGETFRPIDPPSGYPALDYLPAILKPGTTISLAIVYGCALAGVSVLHFAAKNHRSSEIKDVNIYMLARFGPAIVATIATTSFRMVTAEFLRILPYLNMADNGSRESPNVSGRSSFGAIYSPIDYFRDSWASWARYITEDTLITMVTWGKGLVLQVITQDRRWTVIIHGTVAVVLATYFLIIMGIMIYLTWWLWSRKTGLRADWDPQSIADMLSLFRWCDFPTQNNQEHDSQHAYGDIRADAARMVFRIGYWERKTEDSTEIVYGIRTLHSTYSSKTYSSERKWSRFKAPGRNYPYLCSPFDDPHLLGYIVVTVLLLAWFLTVWGLGYIKHGFIMDHHWHTQRLDQFHGNLSQRYSNITVNGPSYWFNLDTTPDGAELLLVSFVLRALPVSLVAIALSYSTPLDVYHRFLQPFYNMAKGPCKAENSILLDYLNASPAQVIAQAYSNSHWKVLWYSILNVSSPFLAILPWGVMTLTDTGTHYVFMFSQSLFWSTICIMVVFLGSFVAALPTDKRRLPRRLNSLLDIWAMCSESRLVKYPEFADSWTKKDLFATIHLRHDKYALGVLKGEDGVDHLGFDVYSSGKEEMKTNFVEHVEPSAMIRWGTKKKDNTDEMEMYAGC